MFAVPTYITVDGVEPAHRRLLDWASLTLTLPAILYCAAPFFRGAWRDLRHLRPGMDVPVALGLGAAFVASAWATFRGEGAVYYDSVTMFIALLLVARYVEQIARRRAGDAIESVARAAARDRRAPDRVARTPRRGDGRRGIARARRRRAGAPRRVDSRRRRRRRRPRQRRGGDAHRRESMPRARAAAMRCSPGASSATARSCSRQRGGRRDAPGVDRAAGRARRRGAAAPRPPRRSRRQLVRRRAARARRR